MQLWQSGIASQAAWYRMESGPKSQSGTKIGQKIENGPRPEMGKKWPRNGEKMGFGVTFLFFRHFFPCRAEGHFLFFGHYFPFLYFGPFPFYGLTRKSGTKKGHKHKEFGQKPPLPDPPQGTPEPAHSLCLGPLFPFKYRKKAYIKNFERGVLGAAKFFMLNFFTCFFFAPETETHPNFLAERQVYCQQCAHLISKSVLQKKGRKRRSG